MSCVAGSELEAVSVGIKTLDTNDIQTGVGAGRSLRSFSFRAIRRASAGAPVGGHLALTAKCPPTSGSARVSQTAQTGNDCDPTAHAA